MPSNYVAAGFETLSNICERFLNEGNDHYTSKDLDSFFLNSSNKFLHSFGQNFKDKKNYDNYNTKERELLEKCRATGFFDNSTFIVDSGGFQISIGLLTRKQADILFDKYYQFLLEDYKCFDRAFILDLSPGPNCEIFKNFSDVERINTESYTTAAQLPDESRKKVVYIQHFRTPNLWRIFNNILNNGDMFDRFDYFATGGIVANMKSDCNIPCIIYVLPLIPLINKAIKYNRKELHFHILGGASFRDILFYELFSKHVRDVHHIDLQITYDSSGMFKQLMVGRTIPIYHDDILYKMDLRSNYLETRAPGCNFKTQIVYQQELQGMAQRHNLKNIPVIPVYDESTGTFYRENTVYSLLYMLDIYCRVQNNMKKAADYIYKLYLDNNIEEFIAAVEFETRMLNGGKPSRKQKVKAASVIRSFEMLTNLDEDLCKRMVDKFLSGDEFTSLLDDHDDFLTF